MNNKRSTDAVKDISIAVALVLDDSGKSLLVRKKDTVFFMQPGGKIEIAESALEALHREIREELATTISSAKYIGRHQAPAANEPDRRVVAEVFAVELEDSPQIGAEIAEICWFDRSTSATHNIAPLSLQLLTSAQD